MKTFLLFVIKLYVAAMLKLKELRLRFRMRPGNYERAVHRAMRLHKKTGKRYRVFFILDEYKVWCRHDIKRRKNAEILKRNMKAGEDFDRIAYFDTNHPEVLFNGKNTKHI